MRRVTISDIGITGLILILLIHNFINPVYGGDRQYKVHGVAISRMGSDVELSTYERVTVCGVLKPYYHDTETDYETVVGTLTTDNGDKLIVVGNRTDKNEFTVVSDQYIYVVTTEDEDR